MNLFPCGGGVVGWWGGVKCSQSIILDDLPWGGIVMRLFLPVDAWWKGGLVGGERVKYGLSMDG